MDTIINLIIDIIFIFTTTNIVYCLLNKDKRKRINIIIFQTAWIILNIMLGLILSKLDVEIYTILLFFYEVICFIIIINTFIENKKRINWRFVTDKKEKLIILFSLIIGIIYLLVFAITNFRYIFPCSEYGTIGNLFFNADIHRGVLDLSNFTGLITYIHPLYRFINLPITLILSLLDTLLSALEINAVNIYIINGYIITIVQIFLNSLSVLILYKILKKSKIHKSLCFIGSTLFIFSSTFMLLSILPETYAVTMFSLLLMIYLYINNKKSWIAVAPVTVGLNLMMILPVGVIILDILSRKIKKISFSKKQKILFLIVALLLIIISVPICKYFYKYIYRWSDNTNIVESIKGSLNKFLIPFLLGTNFVNINPFFVQQDTANIGAIILFGIILINAIMGYIINARKSFLVNLCITQLIVGFVLHVIVGYGLNNGILYAPLYTWAFIILAINGFQYIYNKNKVITPIIITIVFLIGIYNIIWFIDLRNNIAKQSFTIPYKQNSVQIDLKYENNEIESFRRSNTSIIQLSTGKEVLTDIDVQYVNNKNSITGILNNGKWFKIFTDGNKLLLNLSGNIKEITKEKFFIFGMGLREKYLLVKDNSYYKLIRYSDKSEILKNIIVEDIDYENYIVYAKDIKGEKIKIYENENGIYINEQTLDDSVKINIPSFEGYNHKKQLKILLNEVMVNITKEGPKPNFIAYDGVWYRDSAIVAMVLEKTDNLQQIEKWIESIDSIYDMQNGIEEADNLGQVLFLMSLIDNKNNDLINRIIEEAESLKNEEGYIDEITDGEYHPVYQTKWLIYGLKKLNLDYKKWNIPDINDSYEALMWFDKNENKNINIKNTNRWIYIMFAYLHYNNETIEMLNTNYPMSLEYRPSKANFENLRIINNDFADSKIVVPHSWGAAEMFLYLLDLDRK